MTQPKWLILTLAILGGLAFGGSIVAVLLSPPGPSRAEFRVPL